MRKTSAPPVIQISLSREMSNSSPLIAYTKILHTISHFLSEISPISLAKLKRKTDRSDSRVCSNLFFEVNASLWPLNAFDERLRFNCSGSSAFRTGKADCSTTSASFFFWSARSERGCTYMKPLLYLFASFAYSTSKTEGFGLKY